MAGTGQGPLLGLRVLQVGGLGAVPFCGMLLTDMGAEVLRLGRPPNAAADHDDTRFDVLNRSRRLLCVDLKKSKGVDLALNLAGRADALLEGFRPGVMERLGLGPEVCLAQNPRLVYGRMTGWGQTGPLAARAGHDINYIALSGLLHTIGAKDGPPTLPLNLLGDFAGGGAMLAVGLLSALWEAQRSGIGQIVDLGMLDGAALMMAWVYGELAAGRWRDQRGTNEVDGGRPFYDVYETKDGRYLAIGPIEAKFVSALCEAIGLHDPDLDNHLAPSVWPKLRARLKAIFLSRTRDEWCRDLEGRDVCVTPVLSLAEAPHHTHNRDRGIFLDIGGVVQPAPAPRFSRTPLATPLPPPRPGQDSAATLSEWGVETSEIEALLRGGIVV